MLPEGTLPASLQVLLAMFQPFFTAPSFRTFCALACGFWAQTGRRTVCGMLTGAGLAGSCRRRAPAAAAGPRVKGPRLPALDAIAATAAFAPVTVTRYRKTATVQAAVFTCLWYTVFGTRPVQVVLVRDRAPGGYDIALVTTDLDASPAQVIERYAARWSIEVAFEDARQVFGAGQARNRTARAVRATVPFTLACQSLAIIWYATAGHDPADVAEHRARAPWYAAKAEPSTADMAAKLRRVLIAAKFRLPRPGQPTPAEISAIRLAWATRAA